MRKEILWRLCSIFSETFYQAWLSVASRKLTFGSQSGVSRPRKNLANWDKYISKIQWIFPSDLGEETLADKDANSRLVSNVDTEESVDQRLVTAWQHFCNSFSQFDQKHTVCFFVFVQSLNSQMWCAFSNVTNVFVWLEKCIFLCYITLCCRKWPKLACDLCYKCLYDLYNAFSCVTSPRVVGNDPSWLVTYAIFFVT